MVSVIITTHNRCNLLERAIQSVLNQIYKDFELIVVADGCTDGTDSLMKKYESEKRIQYIHYSPAKGGNYARNKGVQNSRGEFIAFLDDDDEWLPEKLELQVAKIREDPECVLVYTGIRVVYVNECIEYSSIPKANGDLSKVLLFNNIIGSTSTPLITKSVLDNSGLFDEQLGALQDYDLWLRISEFGKVLVIPKEMVNYYNYTTGKQVSAITDRYVDAIAYINKKYSRRINNLSPEEKVIKESCDYYLLANKAMRNNNKKLSRSYFIKALRVRFRLKYLIYYVFTFTSYRTLLKFRRYI